MLDIKTIASVEAAILFLIIGSGFMYNLTQKVFGKLFTVSVNSCPTTSGLVLHAVVFGLVTYLLMLFSVKYHESYENTYRTSNFSLRTIIDPLLNIQKLPTDTKPEENKQ